MAGRYGCGPDTDLFGNAAPHLARCYDDPRSSGLLLYNEDERERIASIFASFTLSALKKSLLETERFYLGLNKGVNTRMILEALFLEIHTFLKE